MTGADREHTRGGPGGQQSKISVTLCVYAPAMLTPSKYRKRPVVIEAVQFRRGLSADEAMEIYRWIETNTAGSFEPMAVIEGREPYPASGVSIDPRDGRIIISTLEGLHWVDHDDWVIRGIAGEFYPCKNGIFQKSYERVSE